MNKQEGKKKENEDLSISTTILTIRYTKAILNTKATQNTNFLRNMLDPLQGDQPKHYKGEKWFPTHSPADNGGVHINSGVPNYLYYLIMF